MITDDHLAAVIAKLALNYNRQWEDEEAVYAVFDMWKAQLAASLPADVEAALAATLADINVRFFPTIAEFRGRVIQAAADRHRAAHNAAYPDEQVKCMRCLDSGWLQLGEDDAGYWWVNVCPSGCKPPPTRRRRARMFRGRRAAPGPQQGALALSAATLEAAVDGQHRMVGEHEEF